MSALLLEQVAAPETGLALQRMRLSERDGYDEGWLQSLLFAHPDLIPLDRMEPGAGPFVPLCREFPLPREGGTVYPDLLGVTPSGRLVIVECKLWRNPQARREVVAQALEYAALLRGWSFGDLTTRLRDTRGLKGRNPIFSKARQRVPTLDEAAFVDALARSLTAGDFHLIIAGDGIRSDLQAIAGHLNASGNGPARLTLLEVQLWGDDTGRIVVLPTVPLRTEIIEYRVVMGSDSLPLRLESSGIAGAAAGMDLELDQDRAAERARNRAFWQKFIDDAHFDHPDQPPPRHGGNNWVRLDIPIPGSWLTVYRTRHDIGMSLTFSGEDGEALFEALEAEAGSLRDESGLDIHLDRKGTQPFKGQFSVAHKFEPNLPPTDGEQLVWLSETANRLISLLRPRIHQRTRARE